MSSFPEYCAECYSRGQTIELSFHLNGAVHSVPCSLAASTEATIVMYNSTTGSYEPKGSEEVIFFNPGGESVTTYPCVPLLQKIADTQCGVLYWGLQSELIETVSPTNERHWVCIVSLNEAGDVMPLVVKVEPLAKIHERRLLRRECSVLDDPECDKVVWHHFCEEQCNNDDHHCTGRHFVPTLHFCAYDATNLYTTAEYLPLTLEYFYTDVACVDGADEPPRTEAQLRIFIRETLQHLRDLHSQWLVHHDISPDNIFLRPTVHGWETVLADLGTCKSYTVDPTTGDLEPFEPCSTRVQVKVSYASPEFLQRRAYSGIAYDLWALAQTIVTCMLGKPLIQTFAAILATPAHAFTATAAAAGSDSSEPFSGGAMFSPAAADMDIGVALLCEWDATLAARGETAIPPSPTHYTALEALLYQEGRFSPLLIDLLGRMLRIDPLNRLLSVDAVLAHPWFAEEG